MSSDLAGRDLLARVEELISDDVVAISELVKNAYDADATDVECADQH